MADSKGAAQKIEWEIEQIAIAIDYFERAIQQSFFTKEVEEHRKTIHKLQGQMQELERKRDAVTA